MLIGSGLFAMEGGPAVRVCDCGRHYATEEEVARCQAKNHAGAAEAEAWDALMSTPDEYRDEEWHEAVADLEERCRPSIG